VARRRKALQELSATRLRHGVFLRSQLQLQLQVHESSGSGSGSSSGSGSGSGSVHSKDGSGSGSSSVHSKDGSSSSSGSSSDSSVTHSGSSSACVVARSFIPAGTRVLYVPSTAVFSTASLAHTLTLTVAGEEQSKWREELCVAVKRFEEEYECACGVSEATCTTATPPLGASLPSKSSSLCSQRLCFTRVLSEEKVGPVCCVCCVCVCVCVHVRGVVSTREYIV
jgi:hypothetical protein